MNAEKEWKKVTGPQATRRSPKKAPAPRSVLALRLPSLAHRIVLRCELRALGPRVGNHVLQRLANDDAFVAPERVERAIESQRGGGKPLESGMRVPMEGALGTDFSDVRVHDGSEAAALNQDLSARAFTHGSDIFFGAGEYVPASGEGQRLLAHELAHVVQQEDGAKLTVGAANDPAEREADEVAQAVLQRLHGAAREEEQEPVQMLQQQEMPEEEELQMLRRQEMPEEEEEFQMLRRQEDDQTLAEEEPARLQEDEEREEGQEPPAWIDEEEEELLMPHRRKR